MNNINLCLFQNHNKLEKADIMEMTVRYIEDQQQRQISQGIHLQKLFGFIVLIHLNYLAFQYFDGVFPERQHS